MAALSDSIEINKDSGISDNELRDDDSDGIIDEIIDGRRRFNDNYEFFYPEVGQSYERTADSYLDMNMFKLGKKELNKYLKTINGQLPQPIYELIKSDTLNPDTLTSNSRFTRGNAETKYLYLKRRYFVGQDNDVHDKKREDRTVCQPDLLYDLIINAHLMNSHIGYQPLHAYLSKIYSNASRECIRLSVKFCSLCNSERKIPKLEKKTHVNIYKNLFPFERIHIEIFEPFKGQLIEKKYSHILYCRDYHSRFVWLFPLKSIKFKQLTSAISKFFLNLPRIPIYLETSSMERQDIFDICQRIITKYHLQLGLGIIATSTFHSNGITRMKHLLALHEDECINDWTMCLKYGSRFYNKSNVTTARGVPNELLCKEINNCSEKFEIKKKQVIEGLPLQNLVSVENGKGMIYLEEGNNIQVEEEELDT